jgi:hypothetical protein
MLHAVGPTPSAGPLSNGLDFRLLGITGYGSLPPVISSLTTPIVNVVFHPDKAHEEAVRWRSSDELAAGDVVVQRDHEIRVHAAAYITSAASERYLAGRFWSREKLWSNGELVSANDDDEENFTWLSWLQLFG